ncbi:hypothetical protein JAAARDRAFT_193735 [Jaapia argillacea MUCL 33604]|uniref:Glucose receptor Git3 N-terminal domain-containing protein n=1 Tax=Jaapia argillacea MUCL 33604 TaxID=933084 RepID=A0A067Q487_9AGAM|nr:hypothetical protein JAAARDRAFT_193735 [Jaapia argillacea MUCL 33604]
MLDCTSLGLNNGPSPWDQSPAFLPYKCSSWECAKCTSPTSNGWPTEPPCYYYLNRCESVQFAVVVSIASLSLLSVLTILLVKVRRRFIREPIDIYLVSLFIADAIQALGSVLSVRWIVTGVVQEEHFCTAQGVIQQLGETVVALSTWTFAVLWWNFDKIHLMWLAWLITGLIWLFVGLWVIIGPLTNAHYMMPSPYWCWIGKNHFGDQVGGQYTWYWTTLFFSALLYVLLFLKRRGNITVNENMWWKFCIHKRVKGVPGEPHVVRPAEPDALSLAWIMYPVVYGFLILPLTGVRFKYFVKKTPVSPSATFGVMAVYSLSGLANTILFTLTRATLIQGSGSGDEVDRISVLGDNPPANNNPATELQQMSASAPAVCRCRIHPESLGIVEERGGAAEAGPSSQSFRRQEGSRSSNVDQPPYRYQPTRTARSAGVV